MQRLFHSIQKARREKPCENGRSSSTLLTARLLGCTMLSAHRQHGRVSPLQQATSFTMSSQPTPSDEHVLMQSFVEPLSQISPAIAIHSSQISFLESPSAFLDSLLSAIYAAQDSILLASLYIGCQAVASEAKLMHALEAKLERAKSTFTLTILLDGLRAHRLSSHADGSRSSQSMLAPLVAKYPTQVKVIYYTHAAQAVSPAWLPSRWNETIGYLQHMKFYVFDGQHVLLSGANLSHDYFTNRMDRYMWIRDCSRLGIYYQKTAAFAMAFQRESRMELGKQKRNKGESAIDLDFLKPHSSPATTSPWTLAGEPQTRSDTMLFPSLQIPGVVDQEHVLTSLILRSAMFTREQKHVVFLSTAYFNLAEAYCKIVDPTATLAKGKQTIRQQESLAHEHQVCIYTAAPQSNGFYGSKGLSQYIPHCYDYLAQRARYNGRLSLWEWAKPGWTFHAKGLWVSRQEDPSLPFLTTIGSSNYGHRSIQRDWENGLTIVTNNLGLRQQFQKVASPGKELCAGLSSPRSLLRNRT